MNASLFSEHEAQFKASVLYDTWSHMDAKPNDVHAVSFYVAVSDRETLVFKLDMPTLDGGPAFHNDIEEYCYKRFLEKDAECGVYKFKGTYQLYKRSNPESEMYGYFKGKITQVKLQWMQSNI